MAGKFRGFPRVLFYAAAVVYPGLIFYFLVIRKTGIRTFSLFVISFALLVFITASSKKKVKENRSLYSGILSSF